MIQCIHQEYQIDHQDQENQIIIVVLAVFR
jgi:hypothetical protein